MKNLIVTAVILLGSLSMNAATAVQEESILNIVNVQDDYKEVALDALPAEVLATIKNSFPGSKLVKAYVNTSNQYKLELTTGTANHFVYTDDKGNIAKK
jgi:hypothetical protein